MSSPIQSSKKYIHRKLQNLYRSMKNNSFTPNNIIRFQLVCINITKKILKDKVYEKYLTNGFYSLYRNRVCTYSSNKWIIYLSITFVIGFNLVMVQIRWIVFYKFFSRPIYLWQIWQYLSIDWVVFLVEYYCYRLHPLMVNLLRSLKTKNVW